MNRGPGGLAGRISTTRGQFGSLVRQSERSILLEAVLAASMVSLGTGLVLAHYYSIDVITSLLIFLPADCYVDWGLNVGRHCFSDYAIVVDLGTRANPWDPASLRLPPDFKPASSNYPAAGMVLQVAFGLVGKMLGAPRIGLLCYLIAMTAAVLTPAVWASRGAQGTERFLLFLACGVAAVPAWVVIDRGNAVGFVVPAALFFLIALCRQRWGLAVAMVIVAALFKPQFAVLAVVLFAARQWRMGGLAVVGVGVSNLAAYVLWPRDFPHTIMQSMHNILGYSGAAGPSTVEGSNVSFGKALLSIPDGIKAQHNGGKIPVDFLATPRSMIGNVLLLLVVVIVIALGKRISPVMAGIVLLATASLFPALSNPYYLVFVLPVAALVVRDPSGPAGTGIFDNPEIVGGHRRVVGIWVSIAAAISIAQIALPTSARVADIEPGVTARLVDTTLAAAPVLWLIAIGAILVSYARRPATSRDGEEPDRPVTADAAAAEAPTAS